MNEIKLPDYWTSEQATAVFEFIDEIRELILRQYQVQIMAQMCSDRCADIDTETDEFSEDPDIPF